MSTLFERMQDNYVFAVIRGQDEEDALAICRAAVEGGIKNLEVTYSTPQASKVIATLVEEYADREDVVVGAGTVMDLSLAKEAHEAGAEFLVSPHYDADIAAYARSVQTYYMPGCGTATEIVTAMKAGCEIIKVFPGGVLGASFIKDIHGPIPEVNLMPSGGVSIDNIDEWMANGAVAVGVGSALSRHVKTDGYDSVTQVAQSFTDKVQAFRKQAK